MHQGHFSSARFRKAVRTSSCKATKVLLKCSSDCRGSSNFMSVIFLIMSFIALAMVFQPTLASPENSAIVFWAASWKPTITFIMPMVFASGHMKSYSVKPFCWRKSSRMILATSRVHFWSSESESFPTSCTISCKSSSFCRISFIFCWSMLYSWSYFSKYGSSTRMYLEKEMFQFTEGKCLRCASFLSKPQKTCTMLRVADVTGSVKSPPGGETAPTMVMEPSRAGFPRHWTRPLRS
mmetsp:Transcript_117682/g.366618  ORF Transcript_117682/g.366618 Transcript_117682/m.366618 type:complete len:237 (-) Transcript_117682:1191-1901(-)